MLSSCVLNKRIKEEQKVIAKGTTVDGIERKSWITKVTIDMLNYLGRK
jgi:hypothetical protein